MSIVRGPRKEQDFTILANEVLRDTRLSYRARGILVSILSRPDNWGTSAEALAREGREGREAIATALNELEAAGYLVRRKYQNERGHWISESILHESPGQTDDWKPDFGSAESGSTDLGNLGDKRSTEKEELNKKKPLPAAPVMSHYGPDPSEREEKREPAPSRVVVDYFERCWTPVVHRHGEYGMFPVVPLRTAAYTWLNQQYFRHKSLPARPVSQVLALVDSFMMKVDTDQITPKQGYSIWQTFIVNVAKLDSIEDPADTDGYIVI